MSRTRASFSPGFALSGAALENLDGLVALAVDLRVVTIRLFAFVVFGEAVFEQVEVGLRLFDLEDALLGWGSQGTCEQDGGDFPHKTSLSKPI